MDENKSQFNDKDLKVLRTYTSDMADAVRENEVSVIKIALAEKEKRDREAIYKEAEGTGTSKILWVVGGIILIVGGIVGYYFLIQNKKTNVVQPPTTTNVDTFILYDSQSKIDVTSATNATDLIAKINQSSQTNLSGIEALFLVKNINGVSTDLAAKDFLSIINSTAPGALTRSLFDKYLLGKFVDPKTLNINSNMFLIFQTSNYSLTYASMLDWEKTMLRDLFVIFNINITDTNSPLFGKQWKDIVVNNRDARVLYGENGETILYYVFVNNSDIIIANNIDTLKEVISRIITKNPKSL
jgi:hypothetical protein